MKSETTHCIAGDPYCPCQDGDACHYVDMSDSPAMKPPAAWLIWSGEHKAWWRPEAKGYCEFVGGAGRYTRADAEAYLASVGPEKQLEIVPDPYGPFAEVEYRG